MATYLEPVSVSADLLYAVETDGDAASLRRRLATIDPAQFERALATGPQRLAFWLNTYNAYAELLAAATPTTAGTGRLARWKFVGRRRVPIAGVTISLADIYHGMLRSSAHPWGLGYLPRPAQSSFERRFRCDTVDPRVHFALSQVEHDPPVTAYTARTVDEELDLAVEWCLEETVAYDADRNLATVPRRFVRYRGDFGGRRGVIDFLERYDAIPEDSQPTLRYQDPGRAVTLDQP